MEELEDTEAYAQILEDLAKKIRSKDVVVTNISQELPTERLYNEVTKSWEFFRTQDVTTSFSYCFVGHKEAEIARMDELIKRIKASETEESLADKLEFVKEYLREVLKHRVGEHLSPDLVKTISVGLTEAMNRIGLIGYEFRLTPGSQIDLGETTFEIIRKS